MTQLDQLVREHLDRYADPERLALHLQASHGRDVREGVPGMDALRAAHAAAHPHGKADG